MWARLPRLLPPGQCIRLRSVDGVDTFGFSLIPPSEARPNERVQRVRLVRTSIRAE